MAESFDAIVIGAGQAGPPLAQRLAKSGMRVAIVERHDFGGTCVNTGCIPTKALVASARAAHLARRAGDFGVTLGGDLRVDMKKVKARKDEIAGASREGIEKWLRGLDDVTVIEGHARLRGPGEVIVDDRRLSAEKVFLDVGARARVPELPGLKDVPFLTNSEMMDVDFLPDHLVIVGGSYVGLEFAQMYRRFGSRVTVVEMSDRLISREDEDVSEAVKEILEGEGIEIRLGAECVRVEQRGESVAVGVECDDGEPEVVGSHLLLATGRTPNTHDLGLGEAGIETDERGYVRVDDRLRTNVDGIWALGECNGRGAFTHTAYNDFEIVAANLLDDESRRVTDRILTYGLFIDPPLGRAGMTETQARESDRPVLVCRRPMSQVGRAKEKSETQGFMKVLVDAETKRFLGAVVLGVGGDEVVHSILDMMYADAPYTVVQRAVHIHPTVTELIPTMLADLGPLD